MLRKTLTQEEIILAVMAAGEIGAHFSPVRIQKILFLVDREIPQSVGGPLFNFKPYDYGPFDKEVYQVLNTLCDKGKVFVRPLRWYQSYGLTDLGHKNGQKILASLDEDSREYIRAAVDWAFKLEFEQIVSAIYQRYPDMKQRSAFQS